MSVTITADQVKELRERTGAAMMDCKRALVEANGDIEAAIKAMRESGQAKADKKADRIAADGLTAVVVSADGKEGVNIEVNCETDFVAKDTNFKEFVAVVAAQALANKTDDLSTILNCTVNGQTIEQMRQELVAKIGENIQLRRAKFVRTDGILGAYVHGGRIGVLVELAGGNAELAKDLAMQVAATNPLVIAQSDVPADLVAKEREIFAAQAMESGKPKEIVEKMIEGRIKKFLDEVSLLGQPFVKDPNTTIAALLQKSNAKVLSLVRFGVGEGIEKKVDNFAEEVMAQVRG